MLHSITRSGRAPAALVIAAYLLLDSTAGSSLAADGAFETVLVQAIGVRRTSLVARGNTPLGTFMRTFALPVILDETPANDLLVLQTQVFVRSGAVPSGRMRAVISRVPRAWRLDRSAPVVSERAQDENRRRSGPDF